jgi:hypothetical protein
MTPPRKGKDERPHAAKKSAPAKRRKTESPEPTERPAHASEPDVAQVGAEPVKPAAPPSVGADPAVSARDVSARAAEPSASGEPTDVEIEELVRSLRDDVQRRSDAWWHYHAVLGDLGAVAARALVERARATDAAGGLKVETGERKRTLGGIFFALARESVGPEKWRALRQAARRRAQANPPPRPAARPEPEVFVRRRGG